MLLEILIEDETLFRELIQKVTDMSFYILLGRKTRNNLIIHVLNMTIVVKNILIYSFS